MEHDSIIDCQMTNLNANKNKTVAKKFRSIETGSHAGKVLIGIQRRMVRQFLRTVYLLLSHHSG